MRIKRKLDMDRYEKMLRDLEEMKNKEEISEQTYEEMKEKYEEKLKELEDSYFEEDEAELELELEGLDDLGERITMKVEKAVSSAMDKVHTMMSEMPDSFDSGRTYTTEDVYEGEFDTDQIYIDFSTVNGHIDLKKWDQDTYKVVATKKARSLSEERAQRKLEKMEAEFEHQKNGKDVLELHAGGNTTVDITGYFPAVAKGGLLSKDQPIHYDLKLRSVNGHVSVIGLHTGETRLETVNGRIGLEEVNARDLDAETTNGRILLEDTEVERGSLSTENGRLELLNARGNTMTASTENGSVRGKVSFHNAELKTENGSLRISPKEKGEYTLVTENGSIRIDLDRTVPYYVEAKTAMGRIKAASDLDATFKGKRYATVQHEDFEGAEQKISIDAETDMGSVKIY